MKIRIKNLMLFSAIFSGVAFLQSTPAHADAVADAVAHANQALRDSAAADTALADAQSPPAMGMDSGPPANIPEAISKAQKAKEEVDKALKAVKDAYTAAGSSVPSPDALTESVIYLANLNAGHQTASDGATVAAKDAGNPYRVSRDEPTEGYLRADDANPYKASDGSALLIGNGATQWYAQEFHHTMNLQLAMEGQILYINSLQNSASTDVAANFLESEALNRAFERTVREFNHIYAATMASDPTGSTGSYTNVDLATFHTVLVRLASQINTDSSNPTVEVPVLKFVTEGGADATTPDPYLVTRVEQELASSQLDDKVLIEVNGGYYLCPSSLTGSSNPLSVPLSVDLASSCAHVTVPTDAQKRLPQLFTFNGQKTCNGVFTTPYDDGKYRPYDCKDISGNLEQQPSASDKVLITVDEGKYVCPKILPVIPSNPGHVDLASSCNLLVTEPTQAQRDLPTEFIFNGEKCSKITRFAVSGTHRPEQCRNIGGVGSDESQTESASSKSLITFQGNQYLCPNSLTTATTYPFPAGPQTVMDMTELGCNLVTSQNPVPPNTPSTFTLNGKQCTGVNGVLSGGDSVVYYVPVCAP